MLTLRLCSRLTSFEELIYEIYPVKAITGWEAGRIVTDGSQA